MAKVTLSVPRISPRMVSHTIVAVVAIVLTYYAPRFIHPEKHTGPLRLKLVDAHSWPCGKIDNNVYLDAAMTDKEKVTVLSDRLRQLHGEAVCSQRKQYWERPNGEIVVMEWDGTMPAFSVGVDAKGQPIEFPVTDITYRDVNADVRHFVKASLR